MLGILTYAAERRLRAGSDSGLAHRRRSQLTLLLSKRIILNLRNTSALLLVWCLAIIATSLSYFFQQPFQIPVDPSINTSHDVTTGSLRRAETSDEFLVYVSDGASNTVGYRNATERNITNTIVGAINNIRVRSFCVCLLAYCQACRHLRFCWTFVDDCRSIFVQAEDPYFPRAIFVQGGMDVLQSTINGLDYGKVRLQCKCHGLG